MKFWTLATLIAFCCSISWGHARLTIPTPRSNDSGIKTGPCGGLARSATPTLVQGGQSLVLSWQETVNHPGKFLFAMSMGNDANFQSNPLVTVNDSQNSGALPHLYSTVVTIPNINCDTCTIQMIQSMEENPSAPSYYYSCADIKIVATSGGGNTSQGVENSTNKAAPAMAGCGLVKSDDLTPPPSMKYVALVAALMLMPFVVALGLRRRLQPVKVYKRRY